jgi:predicted DNA-binding transcriptional regulator YafY
MSYTLKFTEQELSVLSLACLFSRNQKHPRPALESAREKIRQALNGPEERDEDERWIKLEC